MSLAKAIKGFAKGQVSKVLRGSAHHEGMAVKKVSEDEIVIKVKLDKKGWLSSSGKMNLYHTTKGFVKLEEAEDLRINMTIGSKSNGNGNGNGNKQQTTDIEDF